VIHDPRFINHDGASGLKLVFGQFQFERYRRCPCLEKEHITDSNCERPHAPELAAHSGSGGEPSPSPVSVRVCLMSLAFS
jgi:hypothetical protein